MRRTLQLYWLNTNKNRFYRAIFERDLFGDLTLITINGSTNSARGGMRVKIFNSAREGFRALRELKRIRKKRGYEPIQQSSSIRT